MKPRVVLDTNVLVSGLLGGTATEVIRRWRAGAFDLILSEEILTEYEAVLKRPKFKLPPWVVRELLDYIRAQATWVVPGTQPAVELRDSSCQVSTGGLERTGRPDRHRRQRPFGYW